MHVPNSSFIIPARFRPARSLLGRWSRMYAVDARQAESTYIVAAAIASLALLLMHFLGWSFVQPSSSGTTLLLVTTEALLVSAFLAAAFVGRESAITIEINPSALTISRAGDEKVTFAYEEIETACRIDARTFHRHYRRYAETRVFVNRVPDQLLLLRWNGIPVILGLSEDDLVAILSMLGSRVPLDCASSHVDAA